MGDDKQPGPSRRAILTAAGSGAALLWVSPAVTRVASASAAVSQEPDPDSFVLSAPLEAGQFLAGFSRVDPTTFLTNVLLNGLSVNAVVRGIDFRPINGLLYAIADVGGSTELYIIDPSTGAADLQGTLPLFTLQNDEDIGIAFDPVSNVLRVVTTQRQNVRIDPDTLVVTFDTQLAYPADPQPAVAAAAYTDSGTLYGIESQRSALVIQDPPNDGTLTIIGSGVTDAPDHRGFDMVTTAGLPKAYAATRRPLSSTAELHEVTLVTGAPVLVGALGTASAAGGPLFNDVNGLALRD